MMSKIQRPERRTDALSKARIVEAAIEILDRDGEGALTFRALAARLATGSGALYWHVANKGDLLAATTSDVITRVMAGGGGGGRGAAGGDPGDRPGPVRRDRRTPVGRRAVGARAVAVGDALDLRQH